MPQPLPRAYRRQLQALDEAKLDRILFEVGETEPPPVRVSSHAVGGDRERLCGVPAVGPGIGGTSPGTDPVRALLAKERRERRRG